MSREKEDPKVKELEAKAEAARMDATMLGFELGGHVASCQKLLGAIAQAAGKAPEPHYRYGPPAKPGASALAAQNELAAKRLTDLVAKMERLMKASSAAEERARNIRSRLSSASTYGSRLPGIQDESEHCDDCASESCPNLSGEGEDVPAGSLKCAAIRKHDGLEPVVLAKNTAEDLRTIPSVEAARAAGKGKG